jgi:hypothetical protein
MMNLIKYLFPSLYITKKKISIEEQLEHLGGYWKRWGGFLVPNSLARKLMDEIKLRDFKLSGFKEIKTISGRPVNIRFYTKGK